MSSEKIKILYIDDDATNLSVFKASFRRDYFILTASSAEEGFDVLRKNEVHVIIADHRMPGMTGVEFFEKIIPEFPNPVRMLLTGYSDIESVINAINKGEVFRYIAKPWVENELRVAIENAFQIFDVKRKLEISNKELKKRNDELNRFVYSASHELKAPLSTILGIIKLAGENKDIDPAQYLYMIEKSTRNLDQFVKSIVDYYRNQKYDNYLKEVDFEKMVKELIESYLFHDSTSDINFNISVNQSSSFVNDEFRVRVIVNNILSNSIKYQRKENPDKNVSITVNTNDKFVSIVFSDNGIGINKDYLNSVFNMFFRATDQDSGSGIGLYIAKEAVEMILGTIEVDSIEGEGTTFTIQIPNRVSELITSDSMDK